MALGEEKARVVLQAINGSSPPNELSKLWRLVPPAPATACLRTLSRYAEFDRSTSNVKTEGGFNSLVQNTVWRSQWPSFPRMSLRDFTKLIQF